RVCVARFSFEGVRKRPAHVDAARLFSRLVRNIDFACREQDGSILAAFTETDLRSAHVVARRTASVLRHTLLRPAPPPSSPRSRPRRSSPPKISRPWWRAWAPTPRLRANSEKPTVAASQK